MVLVAPRRRAGERMIFACRTAHGYETFDGTTVRGVVTQWRPA